MITDLYLKHAVLQYVNVEVYLSLRECWKSAAF